VHADQERVLVLDEENQDILAEAVLGRGHVVLGMRQETGLEDGSKIGSCHLVEVRLAGKDCKEIENVEEQLAIQGRQLGDEALVDADSLDGVEVADVGGLHVHRADGLGLVVLKRVAEAFVELEWDDGLGQLVEVSTQDVGGVVDRVATPVETLAVAIGRVKGIAQFLDALLGSTQTEDALDIGSYG
jgi:hypothetical protein